jgi:hypothetical protein
MHIVLFIFVRQKTNPTSTLVSDGNVLLGGNGAVTGRLTGQWYRLEGDG